jgi:hypothetical protein
MIDNGRRSRAHMEEDVAHHHGVETAFSECARGARSFHDADRVQASRPNLFVGRCPRDGIGLNADDFPIIADYSGELDQDGAGPAANVRDVRPRPDSGCRPQSPLFVASARRHHPKTLSFVLRQVQRVVEGVWGFRGHGCLANP